MSHQLRGIGTAVPAFEIEQRDAAQQAAALCGATVAEDRLLTKLYMRAGVERRHSVVLTASTNGHPAQQDFYGSSRDTPGGPTTAQRMEAYRQHAGPLSEQAAREAIDAAGLDPQQITHLVTVSCSGFSAPGVEISLISGLSLPPTTARTHIGFMGCHGALNGLRVARAFADSGPNAAVLVCAVELCTLHHQFTWQSDQLVANALFADGAAAAIVTPASLDSGGGWRIVDQFSTVIPNSEDLMSWRIHDHGFQMSLSPQLPRLLEQKLRPALESWLRTHGLSVNQIGSWAIHPGGPRILDACGTALGIEEASLTDSRQVLAEYGNMSSPTVLFILKRLDQRQAPRPCVVLALGPGIAVEAALVC